MKYSTTLLLGVGLTLTFLYACGASVHLPIYQTETEWVHLQEWPSGYPVQTNLSHPTDLEPVILRNILQRIRYRQSTLFTFHMGPPQPLFSHSQLTLLASELSQAFAQALPEEVVAFRLRQNPDSTSYTTGFCFLSDHELHLVIQEREQPDYESPANQSGPPMMRWEFALQQGQRLLTYQTHSAHYFPHWLVTSFR